MITTCVNPFCAARHHKKLDSDAFASIAHSPVEQVTIGNATLDC